MPHVENPAFHTGMFFLYTLIGVGGADIFSDWLCNNNKALPALLGTYIPK